MKIRNLKYLSWLLIIVVLNTQCKKEDVPEVPLDNDPIFNIEGTLEETSISLHAGQNNAFMHTMIDDFNNVHQYSGKLSNGETSFKVQFFPSNVDIPSLYDNFSEKEDYDIADITGNTNLFTISKANFPYSDLIDDIIWTIDGEEQQSVDLTIDEPGKYLVCAEIHFVNGVAKNICNPVLIGYQLHANYQLQFTNNIDTPFKATINAPENQVSKINWYVDNSLKSNAIEFEEDTPQQFHLKAEIEFQNGAVGTRTVYINKSQPSFSIPDFTTLGQKSNKTWDNTVLITLKDKSNTYISVNNVGDLPQFKVNTISDYKSNSNGNEVKLIKGTLSAPFVNTATGATLPGDFDIEIGVAY